MLFLVYVECIVCILYIYNNKKSQKHKITVLQIFRRIQQSQHSPIHSYAFVYSQIYTNTHTLTCTPKKYIKTENFRIHNCTPHNN